MYKHIERFARSDGSFRSSAGRASSTDFYEERGVEFSRIEGVFLLSIFVLNFVQNSWTFVLAFQLHLHRIKKYYGRNSSITERKIIDHRSEIDRSM